MNIWVVAVDPNAFAFAWRRPSEIIKFVSKTPAELVHGITVKEYSNPIRYSLPNLQPIEDVAKEEKKEPEEKKELSRWQLLEID